MTYVKGIDLNQFRKKVDFPLLKAQGYDFMATRVTVGAAQVDPTWETNFRGAQAAGILATGYHVVDPTVTAASQIASFHAQVDRVGLPDLPWVLDCELSKRLSPVSVDACIAACVRLTEHVRGNMPIIYCGEYFANTYMRSNYGCSLWIADPDPVPEPDIPRWWKEWLFWQFSWTGTPVGIENPPCDLDWGNFSSLADLRNWAGLDEVPTLEQRVALLEDRVTKLEGKLL